MNRYSVFRLVEKGDPIWMQKKKLHTLMSYRLLSVEASVTAQKQYVKKLEESLSKNTENVEIANKK